MLLILDNYDSFTFNLKDYFEQLGQETLVLKNDEVDAVSIFETGLDRLVISPGPNTPAEAGNLMSVIDACHKRLPILGICLGHQALGQYFGATLAMAEKPMHGKVSEIIHNGKGIYKGLPSKFNVCRYHSLLLKDMESTELVQTSETPQGECMSFEHKILPITGIQYHPEAILTEFGLELLANWLAVTNAIVSSPA